METWRILLAGAASTVTVLIGAFLGAWLTRRNADRTWFRDKQLEAYRELFTRYLEIAIMIRRANVSRSAYDYDWAAWGAASIMAQLMAPAGVATAVRTFHDEVDRYLSHAARDTVRDPLGDEELEAHYSRLQAAERELRAVIESSLLGRPR